MIKRAFVAALVSMAAIGGTVVAGGSAEALEGTTCSGAIVDKTIVGDLIVPAFPTPSCALIRTTVTGNVIAQPNSRFTAALSTVQGSISATAPLLFNLNATTIGQNVVVTTGTPLGIATVIVCEVTVGGNVVVQDVNTSRQIDIRPGCSTGVPNVIRGSLVLTNNVTADRPGIPAFRVDHNQIGGYLVCLNNAPAPSTSDNTAAVKFGQCAPNATS